MASRVLQKGKTRITQPFSGAHGGVDIGRSHLTGEPVIAHSAGKVVMVQTGRKNQKDATGNASYGNFVKIDHSNGYATIYAHLDAVTVQKGETVAAGQVIGTMGNTGRSFGMHLHFEVRKDNVRIDPTPYLEADLPIAKDEIHVTYRAYAGKWWGEIVDCNDVNTKGFAGVQGKDMTAFMAKVTNGSIKYRVHLAYNNRWLNWISGYTTLNSRTGYAGNKGEIVDAVQIRYSGEDGYDLQYRVSLKENKKWLDWQSGSDPDGYAGILGKSIDCIQCKIVKADK
jgi:hypothetical protein